MKDLKNQLVSALWVVLTTAGLICAGINFQQHRKFQLPEDGVTWVDRFDSRGRPVVVALHVAADSGADKAGIRTGDALLRINGAPIGNSLDATKMITRIGIMMNAEYAVQRDGIDLKPMKVIVTERTADASRYYQYFVGLGYLAIGLFVYFRRIGAPRAIHFYCLCLASFVFSTFHYTGRLNNFDKVMYWGNVIANFVAPTIFLHFCLSFPEPRRWLKRGASIALYVPAALFIAAYVLAASGVLRTPIPLLELRWILDRGSMAFLSVFYMAGVAAAAIEARRQEDPVMRQQVKWLRNGAIAGVLPFTLFYTIPYVLGFVPTSYMNLSVLALLLVPVSWAYAILRYRLMDVDVIFQQGFAYTLATLAVLGIFYALILSVRPVEEIDPGAMVLLIVIAAFVFQPIRNWIQEILDRYYFYRDRYDYRRTLVEFTREMSSETGLDATLSSVAERIRRTLYIPHVAFFLTDETESRFELAHYASDLRRVSTFDPLDLSFLPLNGSDQIFFERTQSTMDVVSEHMPASVRDTIARLDLTYYIPCQVRGKTIAYLGVSRTDKGDFLSSEDLELLATLSGSAGIAIENARLYRSLQRKVDEYERLKEFSENIVESINVGIVAADLEDRVESWNSQMESLTGVPRDVAAGQPLASLFPAHLVGELDGLRGESGIHQIYKLSLHAPGVQGGHTNGNGANGHFPSGDRLMNIAVAPLFTRDQERIGRLIIFDDVTERAGLEQRLVQADKLSSIGLLAAGVAHEVNTPLAVISTYAQMLTKQVDGDDPKSKMLEKIAKQTFRASEIVNSLLNFSRTSRAEMEDIDLNRVIRETMQLIEPQLRKANVAVEFRPESGLPPVRGNFGKLQQVFLNLFLNARDAMDAGGRLSISTRSNGDTARVEISDTGRGISPDDLARIYDPFFTTKAAKKGTGLGLAVTYGIVREHGGTIDVISQLGQGATFQLQFPLVRKPVHA